MTDLELFLSKIPVGTVYTDPEGAQHVKMAEGVSAPATTSNIAVATGAPPASVTLPPSMKILPFAAVGVGLWLLTRS